MFHERSAAHATHALQGFNSQGAARSSFPTLVSPMAVEFEMALDMAPLGDGVRLQRRAWRRIQEPAVRRQLEVNMDWSIFIDNERWNLKSKDPRGFRLYQSSQRDMLVRPVAQNTVVLVIRASYVPTELVVRLYEILSGEYIELHETVCP